MHDEYQDEEYRINKKNGDLFTISPNEYKEEVLYPYFLQVKEILAKQNKQISYQDYLDHYNKTGNLMRGLI